MPAVSIRRAEAEDCGAMAAMLTRLAGHLGDTDKHSSTELSLHRDGFGPHPQFRALIAEDGAQAVGLSLFFPMYSTTRAAAGVYVQDLWVDEAARGTGLGRRLLAATADHAAQAWGAAYLKLTVYDDNPGAEAFYRYLGFHHDTRERPVFVADDAFHRLRSEP